MATEDCYICEEIPETIEIIDLVDEHVERAGWSTFAPEASSAGPPVQENSSTGTADC